MPAAQAYTYERFPKWREFAEDSGKEWFILSTKYGLIRPDYEIEDYERGLATARNDPAYRRHVLEQVERLGLGDGDRITVVDWPPGQDMLRLITAGSGIEIGIVHLPG